MSLSSKGLVLCLAIIAYHICDEVIVNNSDEVAQSLEAPTMTQESGSAENDSNDLIDNL